jgi:hypothetical protein
MSGVPIEEYAVLAFPAGVALLDWLAVSWRRNPRGRLRRSDRRDRQQRTTLSPRRAADRHAYHDIGMTSEQTGGPEQ